LIELDSIIKIFNQGAPNEFKSVNNVSLILETGKITCFQGPSGSGKTTLLSMIGCLSKPTQGRITLNGKILSGLPERFLAGIRQRMFGFVFQNANLIRGLNVLENVMLPAYPLGTAYGPLQSRALLLLDQFEVLSKKNQNIQSLSGGEAHRVAVCRALINDPQILIADEPTANLDSKLSRELTQMMAELKASGKTIIISSHDPIVFKSPVVDRVVYMRDGKILQPDHHAA